MLQIMVFPETKKLIKIYLYIDLPNENTILSSNMLKKTKNMQEEQKEERCTE